MFSFLVLKGEGPSFLMYFECYYREMESKEKNSISKMKKNEWRKLSWKERWKDKPGREGKTV